MKITESKLRQIIREEISRKKRPHQASPAARAVARSAVAKVKRMHPGAPVSINSREGWITVGGRKVVSLSPMGSRPLTPDEMVKDILAALNGAGPMQESRKRTPIALLDDREVTEEVERIMDIHRRHPDPWYSTKVPGLLRAMERYSGGPTDSEFQRKLLDMLRKEQDNQAAVWRMDAIR